MKKLLFILILFITSCTYTKVDETTEIPNVITEELKTLPADTLYVLKTNDYHYYYNKNKVLIEKYDVRKDKVSINGVSFIIILLYCIFTIGLFLAYENY